MGVKPPPHTQHISLAVKSSSSKMWQPMLAVGRGVMPFVSVQPTFETSVAPSLVSVHWLRLGLGLGSRLGTLNPDPNPNPNPSPNLGHDVVFERVERDEARVLRRPAPALEEVVLVEAAAELRAEARVGVVALGLARAAHPVSYTHLTLPTKA